MEVLQDKKYTIEDIYQLPEGKRAQVLNGQIYFMAPPTATHQRVLNYLCTEINLYIRKNKGKCEVFPAPFAVFLGEDNYVEPDISVICDKNKIDEHGCHGAPVMHPFSSCVKVNIDEHLEIDFSVIFNRE